MESISVKEAKEFADLFLESQLAIYKKVSEIEYKSMPRKVGESSAYFLWDDNNKVFEFPFIAKDGESVKGYVIVPSTKLLPPVLEYSFEGETLSQSLDKYIEMLEDRLVSSMEVADYYYLTPLEIAVKLIKPTVDNKNIVLSIPSLEPALIPRGEIIERAPGEFMPSDEVEIQWNDLLNWKESIREHQYKVLSRKPKRYCQRCYSKKLEEVVKFKPGESGHKCSPNCIYGCAPVAWAMLASAWKQSTLDQANRKIWKNVSCWSKEWSSDHTVTTCTGVDRTIRGFGKEIKTTCDGSTKGSQIQHGGRVFKKYWDLNWHFRKKGGDFDRIKLIINNYQSFIYSGQGYWSTVFLKESGDNKPKKAGHSVVSYGYYTWNKYILVALGWGTYFGNKWVITGNYKKTHTIALYKSLEEDILEMDILED